MLLLDWPPAELPGRAPRGSLQVDVYPNPIIALPVGGNVFDFPFEVTLRELGGSDIEIDRIRVEVRMRGVPIFTQVFDETELTRRGYPSRIPAKSCAFRFLPVARSARTCAQQVLQRCHERIVNQAENGSTNISRPTFVALPPVLTPKYGPLPTLIQGETLLCFNHYVALARSRRTYPNKEIAMSENQPLCLS